MLTSSQPSTSPSLRRRRTSWWWCYCRCCFFFVVAARSAWNARKYIRSLVVDQVLFLCACCSANHLCLSKPTSTEKTPMPSYPKEEEKAGWFRWSYSCRWCHHVSTLEGEKDSRAKKKWWGRVIVIYHGVAILVRVLIACWRAFYFCSAVACHHDVKATRREFCSGSDDDAVNGNQVMCSIMRDTEKRLKKEVDWWWQKPPRRAGHAVVRRWRANLPLVERIASQLYYSMSSWKLNSSSASQFWRNNWILQINIHCSHVSAADKT